MCVCVCVCENIRLCHVFRKQLFTCIYMYIYDIVCIHASPMCYNDSLLGSGCSASAYSGQTVAVVDYPNNASVTECSLFEMVYTHVRECVCSSTNH